MIDYKKAYDKVPRYGLIHCLKNIHDILQSNKIYRENLGELVSGIDDRR